MLNTYIFLLFLYTQLLRQEAFKQQLALLPIVMRTINNASYTITRQPNIQQYAKKERTPSLTRFGNVTYVLGRR